MMEELVRTVESVSRTFQERLQARTVYGEPISADGVTVVPVAQVRFGFGGGGGGGTADEAVEGPQRHNVGGGGGGGGGGQVQPLGYIEIANGRSRWVPLEPSTAEVALRALTAAAVLVPIGGRRGFLGRLFLVAIGQLAIGALLRPRMPAGVSFGRGP